MEYKRQLQKELMRLEVLKSDFLLDSMHRNKGKPDIDNPLPYEDRLSKLWSDSFNDTFDKHEKDLAKTGILTVAFALTYEALREMDFTSLTAPEVTIVISQQLSEVVNLLNRPFNIQWGISHTTEVNSIVQEMYERGIVTAQTLQGIVNPFEFTLGVIDERAIRQLTNMGTIWSSGSTGSQIITPVATRLAKLALEQQLTTEAAGTLFREGLRDVIPLRSDIYYQNLASIVVGRSRNYGRIVTYDRLGVVYGQILGIPDARQCERCAAVDGQRVLISDAMSTIGRVLDASTPEDLIGASPFMNGLDSDTQELILANGSRISSSASIEEFGESGLLPPFHGLCRCTVTIYRG
jgi:hypothetical protein